MDKQNFYSGLLEEENRLKDVIVETTVLLDAVKVLIKSYSKIVSQQSQVKDLFGDSVFNPDVKKEHKQKRDYSKREGLTFAQMVLEALELIEQGTANEVASAINQLHDEIDLKKAQSAARLQLSKLNARGAVIGKKIEGKNTFLYTFSSNTKSNTEDDI